MARKASWAVLVAGFATCLGAQSVSNSPLGYSITTPKPINPAEGTTTPSARATQQQNPYLGSVPAPATSETLQISLADAISRGLKYNLGLVESNQASADVHAERLRALSKLLPQITARAQQGYDSISYKEIGIKLPAIPNVAPLGATTGGFGFQDARVSVSQSVFDQELRERLRASKQEEQASALNVKDARDVVALAVGTAYFQVIASASRLDTVKAQVAASRELDQLTTNRVGREVSPEIDSLRAQVERQSTEQRLMNVTNQLEKDKLTLARIVGLAIDQRFELTDSPKAHSLAGVTEESATQEALRGRADLAGADASIHAAEATLRAEKAQRLPVVSVNADWGGGGANVANFSQVYTVNASVSVPLYTGGRIRADIEQAQSDLARKRAEYQDLRGRIAYDVRTAWLDANASDSSVKVAEANETLAERALTQSRDRYSNGVTNYLEVVQAQEVVAAAHENYIESLYSFNVAMISLARAMGNADVRLPQLLGGK